MRPRPSPLGMPPRYPGLHEELTLASQGYRRIAGIDEAGRGSWAGPLVAAAVCLPPPHEGLRDLLSGVRDSKLLTPGGRAAMYGRILGCALDVGIGIVAPATVDRIGLSMAGQLAMLWAVKDMARSPDCLLIDAFGIRHCGLHQRSIVRGDCISLSIASASVVAKVARDRMMRSAHLVYPGYRFDLHKGYGTEHHRKAVELLGPCGYHRRSFRPIHALGQRLL